MATTGASLQPIFDRLKGVEQHHPMDASTFSDWSMEAGDTITVSRDGKSYKSPVHTSSMVWKGGAPKISVNSMGNEEREAVARVSRQKYGRSGAGQRIQQGLYSDVWDEDGHVHSVIAQTASTIDLYVEDKYNQMAAGLALTSSSAALYVNDRYRQMQSGLALTSSSAAVYVNDKYRQMQSGLALTSSSAAVYVNDKYLQLQSGLALTSSSAAIYASSATNAANIVARINQSTGASEIQLDANKVYIGNERSTTVIAGKCTLEDVSAYYIATQLETVANLVVKKLTLSGNGYISLPTGDGYCNITGSTAVDILRGLQVVASGNNYKIQVKTYGDSSYHDIPNATFSRAITSWLVGGGSGRVNVTALPQNQMKSVNISVDGTSTISSNGSYTYKAYYENNSGDDVETGASKTITVSVHPDSMSITRATWHSVSGIVYYGKLYYWDDDDQDYNPVINSNRYWYYSSSNKSGTSTVWY